MTDAAVTDAYRSTPADFTLPAVTNQSGLHYYLTFGTGSTAVSVEVSDVQYGFINNPAITGAPRGTTVLDTVTFTQSMGPAYAYEFNALASGQALPVYLSTFQGTAASGSLIGQTLFDGANLRTLTTSGTLDGPNTVTGTLSYRNVTVTGASATDTATYSSDTAIRSSASASPASLRAAYALDDATTDQDAYLLLSSSATPLYIPLVSFSFGVGNPTSTTGSGGKTSYSTLAMTLNPSVYDATFFKTLVNGTSYSGATLVVTHRADGTVVDDRYALTNVLLTNYATNDASGTVGSNSLSLAFGAATVTSYGLSADGKLQTGSAGYDTSSGKPTYSAPSTGTATAYPTADPGVTKQVDSLSYGTATVTFVSSAAGATATPIAVTGVVLDAARSYTTGGGSSGATSLSDLSFHQSTGAAVATELADFASGAPRFKNVLIDDFPAAADGQSTTHDNRYTATSAITDELHITQNGTIAKVSYNGITVTQYAGKSTTPTNTGSWNRVSNSSTVSNAAVSRSAVASSPADANSSDQPTASAMTASTTATAPVAGTAESVPGAAGYLRVVLADGTTIGGDFGIPVQTFDIDVVSGVSASSGVSTSRTYLNDVTIGFTPGGYDAALLSALVNGKAIASVQMVAGDSSTGTFRIAQEYQFDTATLNALTSGNATDTLSFSYNALHMIAQDVGSSSTSRAVTGSIDATTQAASTAATFFATDASGNIVQPRIAPAAFDRSAIAYVATFTGTDGKSFSVNVTDASIGAEQSNGTLVLDALTFTQAHNPALATEFAALTAGTAFRSVVLQTWSTSGTTPVLLEEQSLVNAHVTTISDSAATSDVTVTYDAIASHSRTGSATYAAATFSQYDQTATTNNSARFKAPSSPNSAALANAVSAEPDVVTYYVRPHSVAKVADPATWIKLTDFNVMADASSGKVVYPDATLTMAAGSTSLALLRGLFARDRYENVDVLATHIGSDGQLLVDDVYELTQAAIATYATDRSNSGVVVPADTVSLSFAGLRVVHAGTDANGLPVVAVADFDQTSQAKVADASADADGNLAIASAAASTGAAGLSLTLSGIDYDIATGSVTLTDAAGHTATHVLTAAEIALGQATLGSGDFTGFSTLQAGTITVASGVNDLDKNTATAGTSFTLETPGNAVQGSAGDDTISGLTATSYDLSAGGNDAVTGSAGDDGFYFGAAFTGADHVNGGGGTNNQIGLQGDYTGSHALTLAADTITGVQTIAVLPGYSYDITTVDANVAAGQVMTIYATGLGASDNLTFNGSAETDGSFRVFGGLGVDTVTGSANNDAFYFGPGAFGVSDVVHGGGGARDQLALDGNYTVTLDARADVETVVLLSGPSDDLNHFNVTVADGFLSAGAKTVYAVAVTTDVTISGAGTTLATPLTILSGSGNDTLTGGAGADMIFGGLGADTLTGGGGNDVFLYDDVAQSTLAVRDTITDFTLGDIIDLTGIDANTSTSADDAFAFIGAAAFDHHAGELRYEVAQNGQVIVQGDVDGDGVADFAIALTVADHHALTVNDFHL